MTNYVDCSGLLIEIENPTTQLAEVLYTLLTNDTITVRSIMLESGIINLSARISDLRHGYGLKIPCISIHVLNKWNRPISYGSWNLAAKAKGLKVYNKINKEK